RPAALAHRRVGLEREVEYQLAQKGPGACAGQQKHGVLAEPAQAGALGDGALGQRTTIDENARADRSTGDALDTLNQVVCQLPQHVVVVTTPRVARDPTARFARCL